jgi:phospholipid/cholesterol/gamma-HCH transport system substrate-binding protein
MRHEPPIFDYTRAEVATGIFLLLGLLGLGYLSISIGGLRVLPREHYRVSARFSNVGGLKVRAPVKVAGVTIGRVESIELADYLGQTVLAIDRKVALPRDTIASITTAGLLGDAYVSLSPGASERDLVDGDRITHTEPALNIADLIGRFAFGTAGAGKGDAPATPAKERP